MGRLCLESVWIDYRPPRRMRRRGSRTWALREIDVDLGPGQRLGVMGGNGSGKTTLLRTLGGVFAPTAGTAVIDGRVAPVIDLAPGVQRELSGRENLEIEAALLGLDRSELRRRYADILDLASLPPGSIDEPTYTYSSGMMLRLSLSLAICCDPDVLVVDEVLAVADAAFRERCLARVAALCGKGTVLALASHDPDVIAGHTDIAVMLDRGRIAASGPSLKIAARYARARAVPGAPVSVDGPSPDEPSDAPAHTKPLSARFSRIGR